ncbi:anti-anti-sigma factor [Streptosporangium becharense]|uniref:Anti-sigma factor antagonist n=1 Tax=Streptosporangium becharense TaxID=1816182 RepID=A0A7W9MI65_9ACTN|nr:STAS domain-containing protein [Streptosporangium becharense]MBB2911065.1 anti-anti-sigma factor [Streptosporangium becharense]MBB5821877.1 anti-anti-sigma factor [Streptosporangium becharense]
MSIVLARPPRRGPSFGVSVKADGTGKKVVTACGEVDIATAHLLDAHLGRASRDCGEVVVDMTGISFMDASGLTALIHADNRARARGVRLRLARVPDRIARLFRITRLDERFDIACEG